eukprot:SM000019S04969  [mRNA]  locus=s19:283490:284527:- [translate_table: standard]
MRALRGPGERLSGLRPVDHSELASGPFKKSCNTVHPATGAETAGCPLASLFPVEPNRLASQQPGVSAPVAGCTVLQDFLKGPLASLFPVEHNSDSNAVSVDIHKAFGAKQLTKMLALGDFHKDKLRMVASVDWSWKGALPGWEGRLNQGALPTPVNADSVDVAVSTEAALTPYKSEGHASWPPSQEACPSLLYGEDGMDLAVFDFLQPLHCGG